MLNFLKKKHKKSDEIEMKIEGMHCVSCALTIDDALEDLDGVISSNTSYAKSLTKVKYDASKLDKKQIVNSIKKVGYKTV